MAALVDLNPHWVIDGQTGERSGMGVSFQCPVPGHDHRIAVMFANPVDGGTQSSTSPRHWQRIGDTFATLTLHPSIHVIDYDHEGKQTTHWHGWVKDGAVA